MTFVLELAAATLALAAVMTATGWATAVLIRARRFASWRFEAAAANAFTGTGLWMLVYGTASYLGVPASQACGPIAAGSACLIALAVFARPPRLRGLPSAAVAAQFGAGLLGLWFVLRPLLGTTCGWPFSDTPTYLAISNELQGHGFGTGVTPIDPDRPLTYNLWLYQRDHLRMGSTFLLALLQALSGADAIRVHQVVMAWGMLLNLGGIALLMRWAFRSPRWAAAGATLLAAAACNPLHGSIQMGFQPQTFGTAYLSFTLALLARATRRTFWTAPNAFVLALGVTTFVRVYSDLAPVLALGGLAYLVMNLRRALRDGTAGSFLRFAAVTTAALALLGNYEWYRAVKALQAQVGSVVGWPIAWKAPEFASFALGTRPLFGEEPVSGRRLVRAVGALLLLLVGLPRLVRDRRAAVVAAVLGVYAAMAVYYGGFVTDPKAGTLGHRWSVFKICKWAFPLVLAVQFVGLATLLRRAPYRRVLMLLPGLLVLVVAIPQHNLWATHCRLYMHKLTGTNDPPRAWRELNRRLDELGVEQVDLLYSETGSEAPFSPFIFHPRPMVNGWAHTPMEWVRWEGPRPPLPPGTALVYWGTRSLALSGEPLPGNMRLLDQSRPQLYDFDKPGVVPESASDGAVSVRLDAQPGTCLLWSPRAGRLRLRANVADSAARIVLTAGEQVITAGGPALDVSFDVPPGRSRFRLAADGPVRLTRVRVDMVDAADTLP